MEGYDVECVDDVSRDLYCVVCLKLIRKAIQTKCGHGMCEQCFHKMKASYEGRNLEVTCPTCREPIKDNEVVHVPMFDRVISGLNIKCIHHQYGCLWVGMLNTLSHHSRECQFALKECPQCSEEIPGCKQDDHQQFECSVTEIDCPFKCIGCKIKVSRKDLDKHLKSSPEVHMEALMDMLAEKDKIISVLQEENESLKTEVIHAKEQMMELQIFLDKTSKEFNEIKSKFSCEVISDVIEESSNDIDKGSSIPTMQKKETKANLKFTKPEVDTENIKEEAYTIEGCKKALLKQLQSINLPVIHNNEVSDSLKFITYRAQVFKGGVNKLDIVNEVASSFKHDIADYEKSYSDLVEVNLKECIHSQDLDYDEEYWQNEMSKMIYISTDAYVKKVSCILSLFQKLKVLRQVYEIPDKCDEIRIGKHVYCGLHPRNQTYVMKIGNATCKYCIGIDGKITLCSNSVKEVMFCHRFSSRTISASQSSSGNFNYDGIYQLDGTFFINDYFLVKISLKNE